MTRIYQSERRLEQKNATAARIAAATAELHRTHGTLGTSYAMIAAAAGVSPQTVYNHYPDLPALLAGCIAHVRAGAPTTGPAIFAGLVDTDARLRAFARAVCEQYEYFAPWLRWSWREAPLVPQLADLLAEFAAEQRALLLQAAGGDVAPAFYDLALTLCDFPAWERLSAQQPHQRVAAMIGDGLVALHRSFGPSRPHQAIHQGE